MSGSARASGFTLLEMIVALMVSSVLVSLVYGMVRIGSRSWESSVVHIEQTDAMRIGWTFLQRSLNNTRIVPSQLPDTQGIHFLGAAQGLEYVTDMPAYLGVGGLHVLTLSVEAADNRRNAPAQLVLERMLLSDYEDKEEQSATPQSVQRAVLTEQLEGLELFYYGVLEDDESPAWHAEWQEQPSLPVLIKIAVKPAGQDAWPVLIAHPRFGGDYLDDFDEDPDIEEDDLMDVDDPAEILDGDEADAR